MPPAGPTPTPAPKNPADHPGVSQSPHSGLREAWRGAAVQSPQAVAAVQ